ncbi:MAG: class I SAM-dependent methyltransferase [Ignavibacteria bacterium]|jgi:ubiquinone/menaquinone biosynthesis C-methylase UbiE
MDTEKDNRVCPVELAGGLDNKIRRFLQNPKRILKPYIKDGMTVLDFGCGPGFFTIEIAKILDGNGKVIAADLQDGMLEKVKNKIKGTQLEQIIHLHKCESDKIGVTEKVDFILCFYVIHEVPDKKRLFEEFNLLLKPNGKILIIEPNFHVSKNAFSDMLGVMENSGLKVIEKPKSFMNRAVLAGNK